MLQNKGHPRLQALGVVVGKAQLQSQLVRLGKGNGQLPSRQQIGIGLHLLQRPISETAVEGHTQLGGQVVSGKEIQQAAHPHLEPESLRHRLGPLFRQALDDGELLRGMLQHLQRLRPKFLHDPSGGRNTDPPHRS